MYFIMGYCHEIPCCTDLSPPPPHITIFVFFKVWILASSVGELLAVQPYAGSTTHIQDHGLGQGPNVVLGLSDQYGLLPGSKEWIENFFLIIW